MPASVAPAHPGVTGAGSPLMSNVAWPVPATWLDLGPVKTLLEPAVAGILHVLGGVLLIYVGWDVIALIRFLGDLPGQAVVLFLAFIGTFLVIVAGLLKTGHWLLTMDPLGRPMVFLWAGFALMLGMADAMPGWLFIVAVILLILGAALYLSPACRTAYAEREAGAERPTPIAFSLTLIGVLLFLQALYFAAFVPMLGNVKEMNAVGEWIGDGSMGTKFVFAMILLAATVIGTYAAHAKIKAKDVTGRLIITGLAVLGTLSFLLASGAVGSAGVGSASSLPLGGLVTWAAILVPLWWGQVPATWFGVKPIGVVTNDAP